LGKDDFKKYWDTIQQEKVFTMSFGDGVGETKLYQGFQNMPDDIITCMENNGY
jgi:hypothetical protein